MAPKKRPTKPQEEEVEFSNVTKFRSSLLGAVERMQKNPAKRYVITKHGEPEAVLMSYQTYSLLTKVMDKALEATAGESREEEIAAAFERLRRERRSAVPAQVEAVAIAAEAYPRPDLARQKTLLHRALVDEVLAVRRRVDELENTLKEQNEEEQTAGPSLMSEKQ